MLWLFIAIVIIWIIASGSKKKTPKANLQATFSFGESRSYKKLQNNTSTIWKNNGEKVVVGRHEIKLELLYFGNELSSVGSEYTAEPALVNPSLKLESSEGKEIPDIGYWPSYTDLLPIQRDAYLSWLAAGRKDPSANIGFVFLFFYGLERRTLVDLGTNDSNGERAQIVEEVKRLRKIYGKNRSFDSYSFNLLQAMIVISNSEKFYRLPVIKKKSGYEMPLTTRAALGQLVSENLPIPAEWAYAWVVTSPDYFPRTPAHRCPVEHEKLFQIKYSEKFGDGLIVKAGKSRLKFEYRSATRSFSSAAVDCMDLPDVLAGKAAIKAASRGWWEMVI